MSEDIKKQVEIVFFYRKNKFLDEVAKGLVDRFGERIQIFAIPEKAGKEEVHDFFENLFHDKEYWQSMSTKRILTDWTCVASLSYFSPKEIKEGVRIIRQGFRGQDSLQEHIAGIANEARTHNSPVVIVKSSLADYAFRGGRGNAEGKLSDEDELTNWITELAQHGITPKVVTDRRELMGIPIKEYIVVAHHHEWSNENGGALMYFDVVDWSPSDVLDRCMIAVEEISD